MLRTTKYTHSDDFLCLEDLKGHSTELALVHMGKESCKPNHVFSGTRDEYIIHFILSGRGFYSAGGNTQSLSAGQMFLIQPNVTVVYCADKDDPWSYTWIGFSGSEVKSILKQCGFTKNNLILPAPAPSEILACFDEMFAHVGLGFSDDLYRSSTLLKLLAILCENYVRLSHNADFQQVSKNGNSYVNQVISYINKAYMKGITVLDIANHIGVSQAHLNHIFQKELNLSVQNFLMDFRMHKASKLLKDTSLSVKEVSHLVGYSDPLVFSKAFKRKFKISPREYRIYKDELELRDKRP